MLLLLLSFLLSIFYVCIVTYGGEQREDYSAPYDKSAVRAIKKERQKALSAGDREKATAIDKMIKQYEAGEISKEELLSPGGKQDTDEGPQDGDPPPGDNMPQGQGQEYGGQENAPTGKSLKSLYKAKEKALKSGNIGEAKRIHAEIEIAIKARGSDRGSVVRRQDVSRDGVGQPDQEGPPREGGGFAPTPEEIIKDMEKEKGEALKSGDTKMANGIDEMIKKIKAGKVTVKELMEMKPPGDE